MKIKYLLNPIFTVCLFLGLQPSAIASPAQDKSIDKLIQLSNISEIFQQSSKDMQPYFDQQAEDLVRQVTGAQTLNIDQQNAVFQISALYADVQQHILSDPKFITLFKGLFQKTFTEEEVQANIAFLSTPLGQSINQKMNLLMSDILLETTKFSQEQMTKDENQKLIKEKMEAILLPLVENQ